MSANAVISALAESYLDSALEAKARGDMKAYQTYMDCYYAIIKKI